VKRSERNITGKQKLILGLLLAIPLLVVVGRWSALPTSEFFRSVLSLAEITGRMQSRAMYVLFVPFSATIVVFFRLVLGIRVLGPFRSVLLAIAFQITGIALGLIFLTFVVAAVAIIRPLLKSARLPYFARVSVILSAVATIMMAALLCSAWFDFESLRRVVYFPIIALCFAGEGFARTLAKEGFYSAMWRGTMTALVAILITLISSVAGLRPLFLNYPELLVLQIGIIVLIAQVLDFRLLECLNPPRAKKVRAGCAREKAKPDNFPRSISLNTPAYDGST